MNENEKILTLPAKTEQLDEVLAFIGEAAEEVGFSAKERMQIELSVEEIFVNIANYAYDGEGGVASVSLNVDSNALSITFFDTGRAYNPLQNADPDTSLSAESRQIGGLGIYLVKKVMDEVKYKHENGQNVLTLIKYHA